MTSPSSPSITVRVLSSAIVLYSIGAVVYAIYSTTTGQGFAGYLMARQMDWFGSASIAITFCLTWVVFGLLPFVPAVIIGATVWPALGQAFLGLLMSRTLWGAPSTEKQKIIEKPKTQQSPGLRWSTILKMTVVMLAITGAISSVLYFLNVREKSLGVYKFDLDKPPAALPGRIGFVQVTGHLARGQAAAYYDGTDRTHHLIVPLTEAGWTPANPIRYFIHYQQSGPREAKLFLPLEFRQPGAGNFGGRWGGRLPVFVEREYTKQGLKTDPGYKIIDWEQISDNDQAPMSNSHLVVLIVGGIITLSLSALLVGIKLRT